MNELTKDRLLELLSDKAVFGLTAEENLELAKLQKKYPDVAEDGSFEFAAAGFQLASMELREEMPEFLKNRISDQADDFWREKFGSRSAEIAVAAEEEDQPKTWLIQWLGWAVAGVACIALVGNIWYSGLGNTEVAKTGKGPVQKEEKLPTIDEKRELLLASGTRIRSDWESPQPDLKVEGDVVWSDEKQEGYMRFRGLPANDKSKETYQLWIFDETQDEATPIDGGVFDVDKDGEAIIPIDATLKVKGPKAFAVTVEKPGGVVVSKREKIVALAKVA